MPELDAHFSPNASEVAAEVIDGEAILINLSTGVYYSLDGTGGLAWEMIAAGRSLGEVAGALAGRYRVSAEQTVADVLQLADHLLREGLVQPAAGEPAPAPQTAAPAGEAMPYTSPTLTIYRDMGDLLALDPPMPGLQDLPWEGDTGRPSAPES
jgi:Coenzyme PQQ synthesis protein D (PqqD)